MYPIRKPFQIIDNVTSDKPKLFIIIAVIVVSALAIPVIIPHINHPQHFYILFFILQVSFCQFSCLLFLYRRIQEMAAQGCYSCL
jgi:hypothetical protein